MQEEKLSGPSALVLALVLSAVLWVAIFAAGFAIAEML